MTTSDGTTPSRTSNNNNNNYAAPHTPIASARRPKAGSSMMSPGGSKSAVPSTPLILEDEEHHGDVPQTPLTTNKGSITYHHHDDANPMSPMHPPRPLVTTKEDQEDGDHHTKSKDSESLFSPMLNLAVGDDDHEHEHEHENQGKVVVNPGAAIAPPTLHQDDDDEEEDEDDDEDYQPEEDEIPGEEGDNVPDAHHDLVEDDNSSQGSEEDDDEFNPYVFIKSLPAYNLVAPLRPPIALPPKAKTAPPISLVLDLDETLVHCTVEPDSDADLVFPVVFHGVTYPVHVRLRPHLYEFLDKIQDKYEVIIFTASQKVYADELLNIIDPDGKYIHHRMFRESCLAVEGNFLKDLNVLGRDLSKSVLVDNSPHAFGYQVDNGIPIESWFDDPEDTELLKLERFLRTLQGADDVRKVIRRTFQTHKYIEQA